MVVYDFFFDTGQRFIATLSYLAEFFMTYEITTSSLVGSLRELGILRDDILGIFAGLLPDKANQTYTLIEFLVGPGILILIVFILLKWVIDIVA